MRRWQRRRDGFFVASAALLFICALSTCLVNWTASDLRIGTVDLTQILAREFLVSPAEAKDKEAKQKETKQKEAKQKETKQKEAKQKKDGDDRKSSDGQSWYESQESKTKHKSESWESSPTNDTSNSGKSDSSERSSSNAQERPDDRGEATTSQRNNRSAEDKKKDSGSSDRGDDGDGDGGSGDDAGSDKKVSVPSTVAEALGLSTKKGNNGRKRERPNGPIYDGPKANFPKRDDILVRNLNEASKQRLEARGFKVETKKNIRSNGQTIARVRPPGDMKSAQALDEITAISPGVSAFSNESYRIFSPPAARGAADKALKDPSKDVEPAPGPRTGQCRDDRCFGRLAIGWHSGLANCAGKAKIGVIDTPVDLEHPALKNQRIRVGSFLGDSPRNGTDWHGTAVLSLLSGRIDSGVPGLAPDAEYYVAEAFQTDASGDSSSSTFALLQALDWLEGMDVKIVNMSFSGPADTLVEQSIKRMQAKGVVFVAAAGNFGPTAPQSYPAAYENVVAVTALTKDRENYWSANRGNYIDLSAPGVKIWTALPGGKEGFRTGTSFAAPFVTGILAASFGGNPPRAKNKEALLARLNIEDLGQPGPDDIYGRGLVHAPKSCSPGSTPVARGPSKPAPAPKPELSFGTLTVTPAVPSFTAGSASGLGFSQ